MIEINTRLDGREHAWSFSGRPTWKEIDGVIYSPMFSNPLFDRGDQIPNTYADYALYEEHPEMCFRWEQAYPTLAFFTDIETSIDLQQYYSSGGGCGLIFRALDSVRFYAVEVTDMGRKGHDYRVALMVSDASGYRTELACGYAPHSVVEDDLIHGRIRGPADVGADESRSRDLAREDRRWEDHRVRGRPRAVLGGGRHL